MSFTQAISDGFSKYAKLSGRSSRSAYWWWTLFGVIVGIATYAVGLAIGSLVIYWIAALALFLPGLGVGVRRLHDTGRTGWWYLIGFIPIVGAIILIIWFCQPSADPNQYGTGPDEDSTAPKTAPSF